MKKHLLISLISIISILYSCDNSDDPKPEEIAPTVTTSVISNITYSTASCGGEVTVEGSHDVTSRGVCWNTTSNPTIGDSNTEIGSGAGTFTSQIIELESNTTYYIRAYATSTAGTSYGNEVTFKTLGVNDIPGIVAYYPFNGNANDESYNDHNGTIEGATLSNDRYGNADNTYLFDGVDDYISLPSDFDIPNRTISLWFNTTTFPVFDYVTNPADSWNSIITCDHPNLTNTTINLCVSEIDGINKVWFTQVWNLPIGPNIVSATIEANKWYNIVLTFSSEAVSMYLDGALVGTHSPGLDVSIQGNPNMMIGTTRLANGRFFDGSIDDIRIYDRVLNDEEIQLFFNE